MTLLVTVAAAVSSQAEDRPVVVNAVGDIMLSGRAAKTLATRGFSHAFASVAADLQRGDIAVGNLEAPLTVKGEEFREKKFRFRVRPAAAQALKAAGFGVLTLANNHIMDFGAQGLADTLAALDDSGIAHSGA